MGQGSLKVGVKDERGCIITKDYGFTVEEENKTLAFDAHDNPELGTMLLFGNQIFFMKFWKDEDLHRGLRLLEATFQKELERRASSAQSERGLEACSDKGEEK